VVAHSVAEARRFWAVRDASGEFPRLGWPRRGYDGGHTTRDLGRFVDGGRGAGQARWATAQTAFFGHVGDSNLHLHVRTPDDVAMADVHTLVYGLVRDWSGTTAAEHGVGSLRRPYLAYARTPAELAVMKQLKQALDPNGILNPGKIFV
jgi:FAD/FMN-containing dehydrogenase